jgi:hypothetical protein
MELKEDSKVQKAITPIQDEHEVTFSLSNFNQEALSFH